MSVAADRGKSRSQFHRSLPNSFAGNLEDLQTYSKQCLSALNTMCQASGHLAETFAALFHDTSLAEAALRMQEVSHDLGSRTQDASTQVEEDVTTMLNRIVNKGTNEKSEEAVQTLARCFLLMLQTQYHFFQTAADLHAPLSRYQELEDLFIGEECQPEVRDACSSWMSASQLTRPLRRGDTLTSDEVNLLETERGKPSSDNPKLMEARRKLESQSMIYKHEIAILPQTSFALLGGFHLHLQCLSMLLRSCCSPSEAQDIINRHGSSQLAAMAMGIGSQSTVGQTQPQVNQQEWFEAVCRELKTTTLQVDGTLCRQTSNTEEDFNIKMKTINNLVKDLAAHLGLMVDVQSITAQIVSHACSSLAHLHSQTAVQLLFGRAYVVTARAAEVSDPYKRYAQVTSQEGAILVEVPSVWDLVMVGGAGLQGVCPEVQENNNAGTGKQSEQQKQQQQQQQSSGLGACEVVYSAKIDLMDVVERRRISLPIIQVKLVKKDITITVTGPHTSMSTSSMTSTTQSESLSSPSGMKRTIEKLVSKFRQRVPISKATPMASSSPSSSSSPASRSAFYLPISQLEVQAAVGVGGGVSPGNQSHTACSSLLSSPSISSGSSTMSSNSSLYERETPDSDAPKNVKMVSGEKVKPESKEFEGKSPMVGPTVTITSEPSPVEEKNHWETSIMRQHDLTRTKKGLASDSVLADLVNLLSGVRARSSSHLDPATQGNKSHHDSVTRTSSSSSTSSQGGGGGWGGRGDSGENINRFGNYNPSFQEGDLIDRIQEHHGSMWPVKGFHHQSLHQGQQDMPHRRTSFDNNNEAEFANYVAMNQLGKRSKRYGDNLNVSQQQHQGHSPQLSPRPHQKQQQWSVGSVKEEGPMSKTWPSSDVTLERNENLNNTWSNPAHDSGSSSDEASNSGENPSTLMSMVHSSPAGPGLLTPVSRRRHSSGEDTLHGKPFCPSPEPSMHYLDVIPMDKNSTKTWPPKMVWQRPNSPQPPTLGTGAPPGGAGSLGGSANQLWHHQSPSREHLNVHAPLTPQWSDPLSLRQPSVWAPSSTPVSPSGSMNTIPTSSAATSHSQGASPNLSVRGHPKLDRRYAYTYH